VTRGQIRAQNIFPWKPI